MLRNRGNEPLGHRTIRNQIAPNYRRPSRSISSKPYTHTKWNAERENLCLHNNTPEIPNQFGSNLSTQLSDCPCITVSYRCEHTIYRVIITRTRRKSLLYDSRTDKTSGCSWQFHSSPAGCRKKYRRRDQVTRFLQFWGIFMLSEE